MEHYTFEWYGGHPVTNFVNTRDERHSLTPIERLEEYAALVSFMQQAELIEREVIPALLDCQGTSTGRTVLTRAIELREALYAVLQAVSTSQAIQPAPLEIVEQAVLEAASARQLEQGEKGLAWAWREPAAAERPVWELALAAEALLLTVPAGRIKECAASDCGTLFVDDSRAGARRWCSMQTCGNRRKVQRFRTAQKVRSLPDEPDTALPES
jgi:predicted RNA-binding Zn ribbon-like protein